eukprot:CAMPEP_0174890074 /NCGR_PEP_ID=MMETSP0167-20121228/5246_1 /TAXON_ID=38298 /ORGANISM="Rhodella maculata, Strain CCMP736" /LENGTH=122 /DNA_ID=CAMNT_0016127717 /DNA_START=187 /DNA_END=553 /DNA_ORIENTATION=+
MATLQTMKFGVKNLQTSMCNGAAARFYDPESLFDILRKLKEEFGVKNLPTFMCGGVAARFREPESLFDILLKLKEELGVKNLQTFICDAVAARFESLRASTPCHMKFCRLFTPNSSLSLRRM